MNRPMLTNPCQEESMFIWQAISEKKKTFLRKKKVSKLQFIVTKDKVDFIFTM